MCPWFDSWRHHFKNPIRNVRVFSFLYPMQQHFIYFLYSKSIDRFYIGKTYNLKNRLILHQEQHYKHSFIKSAKDWKIVF
ncbi:GIY-YIG nuclease family protein [Cellulophaga sp. RHA19]|uniref:GIY-YIG nuclease family protein n=1 Tax=Cellulophaga sp. RHA19 TaxID=1798237 RepID=UPI002E8E0081|nr:GIY-YIG nuclease family protein [Cellulophaga sp. RHA19]